MTLSLDLQGTASSDPWRGTPDSDACSGGLGAKRARSRDSGSHRHPEREGAASAPGRVDSFTHAPPAQPCCQATRRRGLGGVWALTHRVHRVLGRLSQAVPSRFTAGSCGLASLPPFRTPPPNLGIVSEPSDTLQPPSQVFTEY